MIPANETFDGTWPHEAHFFEGNGFRQHYVDVNNAGEEADDVIVCVHGEPTWGYLYRNFIPRLSKVGRVIVPDHMGFGKSETPQDREYTIRDHAGNLERLLLDLDARNITFIMQDWGGSIGISFALRHPDRVKALAICNTYAPWSNEPVDTTFPTDAHKWFKWTQTHEFEPTLSHLGATILSVMKRVGFENTDHVDETWVRAFSGPFPTPESCRGALAFPRAIANPKTFEFFNEMAEKHDINVLKTIPAMCIVGEEDRAMPSEWVKFRFRSFWPNGPVISLPGVGHYLQEDAPETVSALVEQFIQINNPPTAFTEPSRVWNDTKRWPRK